MGCNISRKIKENIEPSLFDGTQISDNIFAFDTEYKEKLQRLRTHYNNSYESDIFQIYEGQGELRVKLNVTPDLVNRYMEMNNVYRSPSVGNQFKTHTRKMIVMKENSINSAHKKLGQIRQMEKNPNTNKTKLKEALKLKKKIHTLLYGDKKKEIKGLEAELAELKSKPLFETVFETMESDIDRLETLIKSPNAVDRKEAEEMAEFYANLDPYVNKESHPLFSEFQMFEDNRMRDEFKPIDEAMEKIYKRAKKLKSQLLTENRQLSFDLISNDKRVQDMYGNSLNIDEVFGKKGIKDINWITAYIQDPQFQFGLSSNNGLIPQYAWALLNDAAAIERSEAKNYETRIKALGNKLYKEVGGTGRGIFRNPDFNIFRARDEDGLFLDRLISKASQKFINLVNRNQSKWKKALSTINKNDIESLDNVYNEVTEFIRDNLITLDIHQIPEIVSMFPELFEGMETLTDNGDHTSRLKKILSEKEYDKQIKGQIQKIEQFYIKRELFIEDLDAEFSSGQITMETYNKRIKDYNSMYNPIEQMKSINNGQIRIENLNKDLNLAFIPRETDAKGNDTGFYNEQFKKIQENETLYEFYEILHDLLFDIETSSDPNDRQRYNLFSIPAMKKSLRETLTDPDLHFLAKLSEVFKQLLNKIRSAFYATVQGNTSYAPTNPLTGEQYDKIDNSKLNFNRGKIERMTQTYFYEILSALNEDLTSGEVHISLNEAPQEVITILSEIFGTRPTVAALVEKLPSIDPNKDIRLKELVKRGVTHMTIQEQTLDLPKVVMSFAHSFAYYKARHRVYPLLNILKKQYNAIQKPKINKQGESVTKGIKDDDDDHTDELIFDGERKKAQMQFNSWFNRAALGNYDSTLSTSPILNTIIQKTGIKKLDDKSDKIFSFFSNNRIMDFLRSDEEVAAQKLEKVRERIDDKIRTIQENTDAYSDPELYTQDLKKMRGNLTGNIDKMKKKLSIVAFIENVIYAPIRFVGLAYNISAAFTNFFEGQFSNMINSTSGRYFPEEYYWEGMDIMKMSMARNYSFNKIKSSNSPVFKKKLKEAELARALINNYDLLQDQYNELQKASVKSKLDAVYKLNPRELTNRIEYLNQAPIIIAILKDTKIKDKKGNESSLWDAMLESEVVGELPERFKTTRNLFNFEILSQDKLNEIKSKNPDIKSDAFTTMNNRIADTIKKFHGDYHDLSGNMLSDDIAGKGLLMFKRWMGSYMYNRFGAEHSNIHTGVTEKGRYRSFTGSQGAMFGAMIGTVTFGVPGTIIGGALGSGIAHFATPIRATRETTQNFSYIQEFAYNISLLVKNLIAIPVNIVTGKGIITEKTVERGIMKKWKKNTEEAYSQVDIENIKANMMDLAIQMWLAAMLLATKAALWDDEDEKDSKNRIAHNIMVNKLMQLSDQAMSFMSPVATAENTIAPNSIAPLRFLGNVTKTMGAFIKWTEGEDIIGTGVDVGESRLYNQFSKTFLPAPLRTVFSDDVYKFGFDAYSKQQFNTSPFDSWYWSEEKKAQKELRNMRKAIKADALDNGASDEEATKRARKEVPYKTEGTSYVEILKKINE